MNGISLRLLNSSGYFKVLWLLLSFILLITATGTFAEDSELYVTNLTYTTGNFYINWTWDADQTEIYINHTLHEQNYALNHYNLSLFPHACREISIRPVNTTENETIYGNFTNQTACIPNNPIVITNASDWKGVEGEVVYLDFDFFDADNDTAVFSTNASEGVLNTTTGIFTWKTAGNDSGLHTWLFNVTDQYGSEDSLTVIIAIGDSTPIIFNLTNTTGNFFVNWTWENINSDYYNIFNGTWLNGTTSFYWNESLTPHATANITVCGFNTTLEEVSCLSDSVQLRNNEPFLYPLPDIVVNEGDIVVIDAEAIDADNDTLTYHCNSDLFDFNVTTGEGSWQTVLGDAGVYVIEIGVADGYGGMDNQTFTIYVIELKAIIWLSDTEMDFGQINLGNSSSRTLTISNKGNTNLSVYNITLSESDFYLSHNCTGEIIPNGTCSVNITFKPLSAGNKNATLTIFSSDNETPVATVYLTGSAEFAPLTKIDVNPQTMKLIKGRCINFTATGYDQNFSVINVTVEWSVSNESVGIINSTTGYFTALNPGFAIITASNGSIKGKANVTVYEVNITGFEAADGTTGSNFQANVTLKQNGTSEWYVVIVSGVNNVTGYPIAGTGVVRLNSESVTVPILLYVPPTADEGIYELFVDVWIYDHVWIYDYLNLRSPVAVEPLTVNISSSG